jgi:hypothetical protein
LQVQRELRILRHAQALLVHVAQFLDGGGEILVGRQLVPLGGLAVIRRDAAHTVGVNARNVILSLRLALLGERQPALQRKGAAGKIAEGVFAAAGAAIHRGKPAQCAGTHIRTLAAEFLQFAGQLAVHHDGVFEIGRSDAAAFFDLVVGARGSDAHQHQQAAAHTPGQATGAGNDSVHKPSDGEDELPSNCPSPEIVEPLGRIFFWAHGMCSKLRTGAFPAAPQVPPARGQTVADQRHRVRMQAYTSTFSDKSSAPKDKSPRAAGASEIG